MYKISRAEEESVPIYARAGGCSCLGLELAGLDSRHPHVRGGSGTPHGRCFQLSVLFARPRRALGPPLPRCWVTCVCLLCSPSQLPAA